jgi:hypothetical protein
LDVGGPVFGCNADQDEQTGADLPCDAIAD